MELHAKAAARKHERPGQELVVLTSLLPHPISQGYSWGDSCFQAYMPEPLLRLNGVDIHNLTELAMAIAQDAVAGKEEFMAFHFANGNEIVIPLTAGLGASKEIKQDSGMACCCSDDVLAQLPLPELKAVFM